MSSRRPQRVGVVGGDPLHLEAMLGLLGLQPGIELVGQGTDGFDMVWLALSEKPDVVVCDLELPGMDALAARPLMRAIAPETQMLLVTDNPDDGEGAAAAGVEAWVARSAPGRALLAALESLRTPRDVDLTTPASALGC